MLHRSIAGSICCKSFSRSTLGNLNLSNHSNLNPIRNVNRSQFHSSSIRFQSTIHAESSRQAKKKSILPKLILSTSLGLVLFFTFDHYANHRIVQRNLYTILTGAVIAADFKLNFDSNSPEAISLIHERSAQRLLDLCESNGGLYTKLSQAVGTQAALLPKPYQALAKLLDDAEALEWSVARKVLEEDLGGKERVDEIFFSIDEKPIACASIAQVHHGYLRDPKTKGKGRECAIKIQRPTIRAYARNDLWCFRLMLKLHQMTFGLPLSYFGQYISDQILQETLFESELKNAQRARFEIENDKSKEIRETCYVPECYQDFSTSRVLTMEFVNKPSCKMTDRKSLEEMGLDVKKVCHSVMELSAAQIFDHGFVQADGHPGNVLVRPHPTAAPGSHQIVLIDHGLYVTLSPEFKQQYAELWRAIFEVDMKTLTSIVKSWGLEEEVSELFASATIMRPWKGNKKNDGKQEEKLYEVERKDCDDRKVMVMKKWEELNDDEKKKVRWENERKRGMEFKDKINNFLVSVELVPKELIFVGRAMRIFQANNQALGSPVNRINILAKHASNALISSRTSSLYRVFFPIKSNFSSQASTSISTNASIPPFVSRLSEWFHQRIAFLKFRFTLLIIDSIWETSNLIWLIRKTGVRTGQAFGLIKKGSNGDDQKGFEDDLEEQMKKLANDELGIELNDSSFSG